METPQDAVPPFPEGCLCSAPDALWAGVGLDGAQPPPVRVCRAMGGTQPQTAPASLPAFCEPSEQDLGRRWSLFPVKPQLGLEAHGQELLAVPFQDRKEDGHLAQFLR